MENTPRKMTIKTNIYISFEILDQKALEGFNDIYP